MAEMQAEAGGNDELDVGPQEDIEDPDEPCLEYEAIKGEQDVTGSFVCQASHYNQTIKQGEIFKIQHHVVMSCCRG